MQNHPGRDRLTGPDTATAGAVMRPCRCTRRFPVVQPASIRPPAARTPIPGDATGPDQNHPDRHESGQDETAGAQIPIDRQPGGHDPGAAQQQPGQPCRRYRPPEVHSRDSGSTVTTLSSREGPADRNPRTPPRPLLLAPTGRPARSRPASSAGAWWWRRARPASHHRRRCSGSGRTGGRRPTAPGWTRSSPCRR